MADRPTATEQKKRVTITDIDVKADGDSHYQVLWTENCEGDLEPAYEHAVKCDLLNADQRVVTSMDWDLPMRDSERAARVWPHIEDRYFTRRVMGEFLTVRITRFRQYQGSPAIVEVAESQISLSSLTGTQGVS